MIITSFENDKIKHYAKLAQKKYRDKYEEYLVEGNHLVMESYRAGLLKEVILLEGEVLPLAVPQVEVSQAIIRKLSSVETPQKVMGVVRKKEPGEHLGKRILILDEIQDPGNLGTIIRSAVAFAIDTIVLGENTVDLYNPKVVRATQGMLFHVNIVSLSIKELIPSLQQLGIKIFATNVEHGEAIDHLTEKEKESFALIVGNEGNGVNPLFLEQADKTICIPMKSEVESLNVAIATSIILYEMRN